jgi:hypothetical protein
MAPGSQDGALAHVNVTMGSNDVQVAKTYTGAHQERLRRAAAAPQLALAGDAHE